MYWPPRVNVEPILLLNDTTELKARCLSMSAFSGDTVSGDFLMRISSPIWLREKSLSVRATSNSNYYMYNHYRCRSSWHLG